MGRGAVNEMLGRLSALGIVLAVEDGRIRYKAPEGTMTTKFRQELADGKAEILALPEIPRTIFRIAGIWNSEIEPTGEGDAAWEWLKLSGHRQRINRAEDEVNRVAPRSDPAALAAACDFWLSAWVAGIDAWHRMLEESH